MKYDHQLQRHQVVLAHQLELRKADDDFKIRTLQEENDMQIRYKQVEDLKYVALAKVGTGFIVDFASLFYPARSLFGAIDFVKTVHKAIDN